MSVYKRFFLVLFLISLASVMTLFHYFEDELNQRFRESVEESMVDQVHMLSSLLSNGLEIDDLKKGMNDLAHKKLNAKIYGYLKTKSNSFVYITDDKGKVIYHSKYPKEIGKDYLVWRDVYKTLKGKYGARSTRDPNEKHSTLYVAAPLKKMGKTYGVVSLGKPTSDFHFFYRTSNQKFILYLGLFLGGILVFGLLAGLWINSPLSRLKKTISKLKKNENKQSNIDSIEGEFKEVGEVISSYHESLEAKAYVEHYIQVLTHELKSPMSAIKGATEIILSDPKPEVRNKFATNIDFEIGRMQDLIGNILEVSSLERKTSFEKWSEVEIDDLINEVKQTIRGIIENIEVEVIWPEPLNQSIVCDPFLIRQAFLNLLENAIESTSEKPNKVIFTLEILKNKMVGRVKDTGDGIPDFAISKITDKFYSLPKPKSGKKGTGLGLSLVNEVFRIHKGKFSIQNDKEGGVVVDFEFEFKNKV